MGIEYTGSMRTELGFLRVDGGSGDGKGMG
jgi:hypothetical protein